MTICGEPRYRNQFAQEEKFLSITKATEHYHHTGKWWTHLLLAMPDHIHFITHILEGESLDRAVGAWKAYLARNQQFKWQRNFFDHRLRNEESFHQKCDYILNNPVRSGLIKDPADWPYTWQPHG
ncbi:MAG: hypothetical protein AAGK14_06750 [Verrucomicrobiota bacterium]